MVTTWAITSNNGFHYHSCSKYFRACCALITRLATFTPLQTTIIKMLTWQVLSIKICPTISQHTDLYAIHYTHTFHIKPLQYVINLVYVSYSLTCIGKTPLLYLNCYFSLLWLSYHFIQALIRFLLLLWTIQFPDWHDSFYYCEQFNSQIEIPIPMTCSACLILLHCCKKLLWVTFLF